MNDFKRLLETVLKLSESGEAFKLVRPLDSQEATRIGVRVDDPKNYPVGTTLYFWGDEKDEDGFWWIDFVTDKGMLGGSISSRQPGVIRFTPVTYKDVFRVVTPANNNVEEPANKEKQDAY